MADEAKSVRAICMYCKEEHTAKPVSDAEAKVIAKNAEYDEDYYRMDEHQANGERCDGSGRAPKELIGEEDDGNYLEPGDFDDEEGIGDYGQASYFERHRGPY